jgi:hypothetical protein
MDGGAAEWGDEERKAWAWAYFAGLPVQLPLQEHSPGCCRHCDTLRRLVDEASEFLAQLSGRYVTLN